MDNYLLRYAIDNVWCNPGVDKQFVYELQQVTPRYGVRGNYVVDYVRYYLPTNNQRDYYHIYQIGQVIPINVGYPRERDKWVSLASLANDALTLIDVYQTNGVRYSMSETYVMVTSQKNLLVAVKINDRFPSLDNVDLKAKTGVYIHFYHNGYFESPRSTVANKRWLYADSGVAASSAAIRQLQIKYSDLVIARGGTPMYFVNGKPVNEISIVTCGAGDNYDFVLDPSIKKVVELKVSDLKVFNSTLDTQRKYIVHYAGDGPTTIDYFDDITVHLIKYGTAPGNYSGLTYHHNQGTWMRQLTHRDYSIPVTRVQELIAANAGWNGIGDTYVKLYIRHGAYERPLVADVSRIWELYRLKDSDIVLNMTGTGANNPIWRAEALERSAYVEFMSAAPKEIYPITFNEPTLTNQAKIDAQNFAGEVFGYFECTKLMNDNPAKVYVDQHTGVRQVDLAFYYWRNVTLFEYDEQGYLLGYYYQTGGETYTPVNSNCVYVEAITGKGSDNLHGVYGNGIVPITEGYNFRVYVNKVFGGIAGNTWVDITEAPDRDSYGFLDLTDLKNPKWHWVIASDQYLGYVRTDEYFYLKEMSFSDATGVIRFATSAWEEQDGELVNREMEIPFGQHDVFMNSKSMIYGLDYQQIDNMTVINNLEARNGLGVQRVLSRGTGFCTPDLKRYLPAEVGFVEYNVLSNDSTYQIHSHKVQRIVVDGRYMDYHDVVFEEEQSARVMTNVRNGAPYQIQTPQYVLKSVFTDEYKARVDDDQRDQWTSEAMTYYFPKRDRGRLDVVTNPYRVCSAFSNKVLTDILKGTLVPPFVNGQYSDQDIVKVMRGYEWLQPFDILNNEYNTNHVRVYPHWQTNPIGLTDDQYDFYRRILKLYLRQPMELSPFIYITRT